MIVKMCVPVSFRYAFLDQTWYICHVKLSLVSLKYPVHYSNKCEKGRVKSGDLL